MTIFPILVRRWLSDTIEGLDDFRPLVLDLAPAATTPTELVTALNDVTATPEIPPDVTQVRIMSLHKSKGLSSPVVVIAGCIKRLLPAAPDRQSVERNNRLILKSSADFYMSALPG